jgi:hypothetical protein
MPCVAVRTASGDIDEVPTAATERDAVVTAPTARAAPAIARARNESRLSATATNLR